MVPFTLVLRRQKAGYKLGNKAFKLNHLLFMKDLLFYGSNRLPGTDCAYFQLGYCYVIQNNKMWSRNHGEHKSD